MRYDARGAKQLDTFARRLRRIRESLRKDFRDNPMSWGEQSVLSGTDPVDFGYTGHHTGTGFYDRALPALHSPDQPPDQPRPTRGGRRDKSVWVCRQ
jgi:hypothetical protein